MSELKKTGLSEEHRALGAKMGEYAGHDMPLQYSSVKEEIQAVRGHCGAFDVSHMGEFFVTGPQAIEFVDYMLCNDFLNAAIHKAVYSPLCRQDGTVIDDLIAYKLASDRVMICVNAANRAKDWQWFSEHTKNFQCQLEDQSEDYSLIAVQGPGAMDILTKIKLDSIVDAPNFSVHEIDWLGNPLIVAKTGYTGESGVEVFCSHQTAITLWRDLLALDVKPCGLVARDVLRLEACFPLYGNEIHDHVTPLDSALKWTVKMDKKDFIGKQALASYQPKYKLIKLTLEKGVPRSGFDVLLEGEKVGTVTSGTMSVTIGKGIALAHIDASISKEKTQFEVMIRNKTYPARKQTRAFLSSGA